MIVKDLWVYQLSISTLPSPPEDPTSQAGAAPIAPSQKITGPVSALASMMQSSERHDTDRSESGSASGDSGKSDQEDDPEVDLELLEEMSQLSELSDKEEGYRANATAARAKGKVKGRRKRRLKVSDTLVVLTLGLWLLRRGIMCVDIEQ
jgi:RNA polymerase I-specific transcription initiation factor RRN7